MSRQKEKIVMMDSDEAASIRTLTGWVDRQGRFWGNDEYQARWCGATHRKCKNKPEEHPIHSTHGYCEECHRESRQAKFAEMEIESSVNDAAIIELKQQYSRLQEARYDTPAVKDVIAERQRQQSTEGWTPEHDDEHCDGELALAASCYAENFALFSTWQDGESVDWSDAPQPANWPWSLEWWKPSSPRRDLVKACALILAEIERGDRAFATDAGEEG